MLDIIKGNFITVSLIIGLILELFTGRLLDKKVERIFIIALILIIGNVVVDISDHLFAMSSTLNDLRYVPAIFGYLLRPSILALFVSILLRNRRTYFIIWVPIVIVLIVTISTPFNHIMFYYDENNLFQRGPLGFIVHIISGIYGIIFVLKSIGMHRVINKSEIVTIIYIIILSTTAVIFESAFRMEFFLSGAMAVSYTIYYIYVYMQVYKLDALTALFNRRSFEQDIKKMTQQPMIIVSIDMNDLKIINDTEGHVFGDMAIKVVADAIINSAGDGFRVYRVGGDEFIALGIKETLENGNKFISRINGILNKTKYSIAYGIAEYSKNDDFAAACEIADIKMYENKKKQKGQ